MRHRIALLTEWAWSKNWISSKESLEALARLAHKRIFGSCLPSSHHERGLEALMEDMGEVLRKLQYGNRSPESIHPKRKAYLAQIFENDNFRQTDVWDLSA